MRLDRLSVRARITLGSLAVAAVLLLIALVVVRAQVTSTLTSADISLASSDLSSFEKDIAANPDETVDDPGTGVLVLVQDPSGIVQIDTLPRDVSEFVSSATTGETPFTRTDDDGRSFVVVGRTVPTADGEWSLWAARSTSSSELAISGLDRVLLIGGLALLAGFCAASWIIASLALKPVEQASARERQMISDAAHELRTPLAALTTQLELAHGDFGDAEALARQVRTAEASVSLLASLASNLLELSRLESNPATATPTPVSALTAALLSSVDRGRMLALSTSVNVDFTIDVVDDTARVPITGQSFGRLVDNLLSNAITAVDREGSVVVRLSQDGGRLRLDVADDGPGMPDQFLPIAFERFTRPDSSRSAALGGSGLGLALVDALVRDAGGTVTLQNTQPGLRVRVLLPQM